MRVARGATQAVPGGHRKGRQARRLPAYGTRARIDVRRDVGPGPVFIVQKARGHRDGGWVRHAHLDGAGVGRRGGDVVVGERAAKVEARWYRNEAGGAGRDGLDSGGAAAGNAREGHDHALPAHGNGNGHVVATGSWG